MEPNPENEPSAKISHREATAKWKVIVAEYQKPNSWRASWQIINSIGGYAILFIIAPFLLFVILLRFPKADANPREKRSVWIMNLSVSGLAVLLISIYGFHHIHHLSSRIPNYHLERCHRSDPMFAEVKPLTLFGSLKSITFRLWDVRNKKLISFRKLRKIRREQAQDEGKNGNPGKHHHNAELIGLLDNPGTA